MWRTSLAAWACGIPAAVTNNGRADVPRSTGAACAAVAKQVLATPITTIPNSACVRAQAGPATGVQIGVTVHNEQAEPIHAREHGPYRRQFPPEELARVIRLHLGHDHGALRPHLPERGIAGENGRRTGTAAAQVADIHGRQDRIPEAAVVHPDRMTPSKLKVRIGLLAASRAIASCRSVSKLSESRADGVQHR
jgi:hypothetical protein